MTRPSGRLLLVIPSATSFLTFFRGVAEEWLRRGGAVAVATGPDLASHSGETWPAGVERLELPATRLGSLVGLPRAVGRLRRMVLDWRPGIVHAHFAAAAVLAAATRTTIGKSDAEWMATFHGMHLTASQSIGSRLLAAVEVWAARRMSQVCVLNREDRDALRTRLPKARVFCHESFGVGCDLQAFDSGRFPAAERAGIRARLGIPATAFVAAYVGRQVAFKGFPAVVRGFRAANAAGLNGWLVLVGEADAAHRSGLSAEDSLFVATDPRVVRTGWQWDVAPYLAAADVSLLPSVREGMPVSAMESLAIGTPVITTDARGCRDVVRDRVDGIVLAAAEADQVAAALVECAGDRRLLDALRTAAIAGRSRFDSRHYAGEQIELYSTVLASRDSRLRGAGDTTRFEAGSSEQHQHHP